MTTQMCNIETIKLISENIYKKLGTGHSEFIYHRALEIELRINNINYETERRLVIYYEGTNGTKYSIGEERIDIYLPDDLILIELKAVVNPPRSIEIEQIHKYDRSLKHDNINIKRGILINFPQPGTKEARKQIDFIEINYENNKSIINHNKIENEINIDN